MNDIGRISPLTGGYGGGQVSGTPLLGQSPAVARTGAAGAATAPAAVPGDESSFSPELGESEGGANALLAAWGAGAGAQAPPLQITGANPGANAGFVSSAGKVGGVEPGMQAAAVMMGPVLRG